VVAAAAALVAEAQDPAVVRLSLGLLEDDPVANVFQALSSRLLMQTGSISKKAEGRQRYPMEEESARWSLL
jgi:hypothetical protein